MNQKIIEINNIENILIKVDEAIEDSYLKDFFFTILHKHKIERNDESRIFYSYLKEKKYYQLSIFSVKKSPFVTQLDILCQYHQKHSSSEGYELYILRDYFALFIEKKLYYYQKIDKHTPLNELKVFLEEKFNINVEHEHHVQMSQIEKSLTLSQKGDFLLSLEYLDYRKLETTFFKYLAYVVVIVLLLLYTFFENFSEHIDKEEKLKILEKKYASYLQSKLYKETISLNIIEIFKYIQKENLSLKSISYDKHGYKIELQSQERKALLKFIKYFKHSQVETIFENGVVYEMQATIIM